MVFMKLRISIIALGVSLLVNAGCSSVKTAYNGTERSHFRNPAVVAAMNNQQTLPPVAEGPVTPETHSANPGGTGSGAMTGMSTPDSWGGSLSSR
jgi:hypothetical protein